ncbi:hypothetical protein B0H13DRAFT_2666429 [Mycena leptocephala]|nr:hypothetical protein B0H13DRAFT_2666429 [Mycena leptocephala]
MTLHMTLRATACPLHAVPDPFRICDVTRVRFTRLTSYCSLPLDITGAHVSRFVNHHPHVRMDFLAAYVTFCTGRTPIVTARHPHLGPFPAPSPVSASISRIVAVASLHTGTDASPLGLSGLPSSQECPHPPAAQLTRTGRTTYNTTATRSRRCRRSPVDGFFSSPAPTSGAPTTCVRSARGARSSFLCRRDLCIVVLSIPPLPRPLAPQPSSVQPAAPSTSHIVSPSCTPLPSFSPFIFPSPVSPWSAPRALRVPLQYQPHLSTRAHDWLLPRNHTRYFQRTRHLPQPFAILRSPAPHDARASLSLAHSLLEARAHFTSNTAHSRLHVHCYKFQRRPAPSGTDLHCTSQPDLDSRSTLSLCVEARLCSARPWIRRAHPRERVHAPD